MLPLCYGEAMLRRVAQERAPRTRFHAAITTPVATACAANPKGIAPLLIYSMLPPGNRFSFIGLLVVNFTICRKPWVANAQVGFFADHLAETLKVAEKRLLLLIAPFPIKVSNYDQCARIQCVASRP